MRIYLCLVLFTLAFLSGCDRSSTPLPRLLINEVMARNESFTSFEEAGLPPQDWVEIYNPTDESLRMEGYTLSDNTERPKKYKFPANLTIAARGFVLVTLAGPDQDDEFYDYYTEPYNLRADFALDDDRDSVFLFANGREIDRIGIRNLESDSSLARDPDPDRIDEISISYAPTPNAANNPPGSFRTRFATGGRPQPSPCTPDDEPVRVIFKLLADPDIAPVVTMDFIARPGCDVVDQDPVTSLPLFEDPGAVVNSVSVADPPGEFECPGTLAPGGAADPGCPQETLDGSYGNQAIKVLTFEALLPSKDAMGLVGVDTVLWKLTIEDEFGELNIYRCFFYGGGCPTLVINEYQARNVDTMKFVCETCADSQSVRTPDWIEIHNYGPDEIDLSEFGLVGRDAERGGNLGSWTFGNEAVFGEDRTPDPDYQRIEAGGCRLVLADNDAGDVRRVYRRLIPDPGGSGSLVPDESIRYYSTRFALNPNRRSGSDMFFLTRPAIFAFIDRAVLDFSDFAEQNPGVAIEDEFFLRDLSAARFPDDDFEGAETSRQRFAPDALTPGTVTDCPSPPGLLLDWDACVNLISCPKPPRFIEVIGVRPAGDPTGGRRCPQVGESALVSAFVAIQGPTSEEREEQGALAFTVELNWSHENGSSGILTEDSGLLIRSLDPKETRTEDTPGGMVLWGVDATIPPQAVGRVTFRLSVFDNILGETEVFGEFEDPAVTAPQDRTDEVSFRYFSGGSSGASLLLSEIVPDNGTIELPGLPPGSSPNYIELHNPGSEDFPLSGHYLAVELEPGTPIEKARDYTLPAGISVAAGGYLVLALGAFPAGLPTGIVALDGFDLDPCFSTLYLVGPDSGGNCVVDSISWDCNAVEDNETTEDLAYGVPCSSVPGDARQMSSSPGGDNGQEPGFFAAYHVNFTSPDDPNPCPASSTLLLNAIFFLDENLVAELNIDAITEKGFEINGVGTLQASPVISVLNDPDIIPPPGYTALRITQFLTGGAGFITYSASIEDACGRSVSSCDEGAFCFSLRIGDAELPVISINEVNMNSPLPGSGGAVRPWLELFNSSVNTPVDLSGMFLSANPFDHRAFQFQEELIIPPGGFLVVLTDGGPLLQETIETPEHVVIDFDWDPLETICIDLNGDCDSPGNQLDICGFNFLAEQNGVESPSVKIFLTDSMDRGSCRLDVFDSRFSDSDCGQVTSMGRVPDGGTVIAELVEPTPGAPVP